MPGIQIRGKLLKNLNTNNSTSNICLLRQSCEGDSFVSESVQSKKNVKNTGSFNKFINKILGYKTECTDGKDDGKLSFKEKAGSFFRGCLNCVTNIVDSFVEHPVVTTAGIASATGVSALLIAGGIVSAPVLAIGGAAAGIGFGVFNIAKGIYSASKADNDTDAKLAFETMGEGTTSAALSSLALKKGITDFKKIKEIAKSAENIAETAGKYADEASSHLHRAEDAMASVVKSKESISDNASYSKKLLENTVNLSEETRDTNFYSEIRQSKKAYENISKTNPFDTDSVTMAQEALEQTKKYAAESDKYAKIAQEGAAKAAKSSTVKQAEKYKEFVSTASERAKSASAGAASSADTVSGIETTVSSKAEYINSEVKNMMKTFTDIDSRISGFDYSNINYDDDGVLGYDIAPSDLRDECRTKIDMNSGFADKTLQVKNLDSDLIGSQLPAGSKYSSLGEPRLSKKTQQYVYICENLRQAPDSNGLRGKTPLAGQTKALKWRLGKIKESGINTIIDLRSEGECSAKAMNTMSELGLNYVNFPVEDCNWSKESLHKITEYIETINKGDFYVGCANGEGRTDIAIAINYLFNPKAQNVPEFYFGSFSTSRVSVKENIRSIVELINSDKNIVQEWGWNSYDEFISAFNTRFQEILNKFKNY